MSEEAMTLEEIATDKRVEAISVGFVGTSDSGVAVRLNDGRWQVVDLDGNSTSICTAEELQRFAILPRALVPTHRRDVTTELHPAQELRDAVREWFAWRHEATTSTEPDQRLFAASQEVDAENILRRLVGMEDS